MSFQPYRIFIERKKQLFVSLPIVYAMALAIIWFFYHVGEQGYPWASSIAYLLAAAWVYHLIWVITSPGFRLELSNEGITYISRSSKKAFIPWNGIEAIKGTYGAPGSGNILPDYIYCIVKPKFRKKRRFAFQEPNYVFDLPYQGIFSVELIGYLEDERIRHSQKN